jgi:aminoglycoside phosphotransferase (APT) family kinase protein
VLFVRVLPPDSVQQFLTAGRLAGRSGFVVPRLAGCHAEAGIAWLANVPGKTVRQLIAEGTPPDPHELLDALAPMWEVPPGEGRPFDAGGGFRHAERVLCGALPEGGQHPVLRKLLETLRPCTEAWRPSSLAHNDFYDDQMIVTPSGRIALVDFEEAGPGDPVLDLATMLAHLRWMARFLQAERYETYRSNLRDAALLRFGWEQRTLDVWEAYQLFRLAANPIRHFRDGSLAKVQAVLTMALETLEG